MKEDNPYDKTINESQQRSLLKALAIFETQQEEYKLEQSKSIKRPNIRVAKGIFNFSITLIILFVACPTLLKIFIDSPELRILIFLFSSFFVFVFNARKILVWSINVYQKYAPDDLRLACVFEPSCSEYMLMAINKYGVIYGVLKGIKRLLRCHYPNGGYDIP